MSERIPQGRDEGEEKGLELGELNLEGKSVEELEKMRDELTSKLTLDTDAETASAINDDVLAIEDKISELNNTKSEIPENKVEEAQEQVTRKRSKKEEVALTADEIRAMLEETSVDHYEGAEELESYGAELVNLIDWARRNRQSELVTALAERIQEVKQKQGRGPKKGFRSRTERGTNKAETVEAARGVSAAEVVSSNNNGEDQVEVVPEAKGETEAQVAETEAQEVLTEAATPENATEEEKKGIREIIKSKWESLSQAKVLGAPIRDFATGLVAGGAIGFAVRTAIRSTVGLGVAGAIAGAAVGAGRRFVVKEYRDFNLDRAEDAFYDKPGSLIEKVKNNKITAADALVLIADWKSEITSDTKRVTDDQILEILNVEEVLIKSQKSYSELKGVDRVEAYYSAVTSSPNRSLTSKAERGTLAEVNADKAHDLSEDIARLSGRRVSGKEYAKAALTGAIGGLIGVEVAHLIGGFFHHDVVSASGEAKSVGAAVEHIKTPSTPAAHVFQSKVPMPEHFEATAPEVVPKAPEVIAPKVPDAVVPPAHAEIPHGTTTHGVAVDRMNLDQATFAAPAPHEVVTPVAPIAAVELNPTDLALKAGINPVEYAQMGVGEMRVGDVMNTISNAAEHGALPDIGLRLDAMHPAGAEWDMTVDEFLKNRAEEVLKSHAEEVAARTAEVLKPTNDQIADVVAAAKGNLSQDVASFKESFIPPVEEVAHVKSAAMQDAIAAKVDTAQEAVTAKVDASLQEVAGNIEAAQASTESITNQVSELHGTALADTMSGEAMTDHTYVRTREFAASLPDNSIRGLEEASGTGFWDSLLSFFGLGVKKTGVVAGAAAAGYGVNKYFDKYGPEVEVATGSDAETPFATRKKNESVKISQKEQRNQILEMIKKVEPRKIFSLRRQPLEKLFKDGKYDNLISKLLSKWESLPNTDPQRADIEHIVEAIKTVSPLEDMSAYQEFRSRVINEPTN